MCGHVPECSVNPFVPWDGSVIPADSASVPLFRVRNSKSGTLSEIKQRKMKHQARLFVSFAFTPE